MYNRNANSSAHEKANKCMNGINWDVNANDSFSKKTEFEALNDSNKNWQAGKLRILT